MNINVNFKKLADYTKTEEFEASFNKFLKTNVKVLVKHFKRDHNGQIDFDISLIDTRIWINNYFSDQKRNRNKFYPQRYRNNLMTALYRLSEHVYGTKTLTLASPWQEYRLKSKELLATHKSANWYLANLDSSWIRMENYFSSQNVTPENFNSKHWVKFRESLRKSELAGSTVRMYLTTLKAALESVGYQIDLGKKPVELSLEIQNQMEALGDYMTTKRPLIPKSVLRKKFPDLDDKELDKIEQDSFFVGASTWKHVSGMLRTFLKDIGQNNAQDMTEFLNPEQIISYFLKGAAEDKFSRETFKSRVYIFAKIIRASECIPDSMLGKLTQHERLQISQSVKDLYADNQREFTKKSKKELFEEENLLSLTEIFLIGEPRLMTELRAIRYEAKELNFKDLSLAAKNKKKLALAIRYRKLLEMVFMLYFSMRPSDLFGQLASEDYELDGKKVPKSIYKTSLGNWIVNLVTSKTKLKDPRRQRKNLRIYFMFPPKWNSALEEYINEYRPLLSTSSPLLFCSDASKSRQFVNQGVEGSRTGVGYYEITGHSKWLIGTNYSENDYRRILMAYLYSVGLESNEALIFGHQISVGAMSKVARDQYLNLNDDAIQRRCERYYEIFEKEMDLAIAKIKASSKHLSPKEIEYSERTERDVTPKSNKLIKEKKGA